MPVKLRKILNEIYTLDEGTQSTHRVEDAEPENKFLMFSAAGGSLEFRPACMHRNREWSSKVGCKSAQTPTYTRKQPQQIYKNVTPNVPRECKIFDEVSDVTHGEGC